MSAATQECECQRDEGTGHPPLLLYFLLQPSVVAHEREACGRRGPPYSRPPHTCN